MDFLSGYKTIIVGVLATIMEFIDKVLVGIWGVNWPWLTQVDSTLSWIILLLGGVAVTHKVVKAVSGDSQVPPATP